MRLLGQGMIISFILCTLLFSQSSELFIKGEPKKVASEIVGVRDANGEYCAALKVVSNLDGFSYTSNNGVVEVKDQPGEDIVYISSDERVLTIYNTGYKPKKIILSERGITLNSKEVWKLKIVGTKSVLISTNPEDAVIYIDGNKKGVSGIYDLPLGEHSLKIEKEGFETITRTIKVQNNTGSLKYKLNKKPDDIEKNKRLQQDSLYTELDTVDNKGGVGPCLASCCISPRVGLEMNEGKNIRSSEWIGFLGGFVFPFINQSDANIGININPFWLYPAIKMGYRENGFKGCMASYFIGSRVGYELDKRRIRTKEWLQLVPCINIYSKISISMEAYRGQTMTEIAKRENLRK